MSIKQDYISLALQLFPHMPKCGEHPGDGKAWGYSAHKFGLDQKYPDPLYRIRCLTCGAFLNLPQHVDWPVFWNQHFTNERKVDADGSRVGA